MTPMDKKSIKKVLGPDLDLNEKQQLLKRINESSDLRDSYSKLKAEQVAQSMHHATLDDSELDNVYQRLVGKLKVGSFVKTGMAVASIFILALVSALFFVFNGSYTKSNSGYIEAYTGIGQTKTVLLADGSEVTLNSNSRLRYPEAFGAETREVHLVGEALFRVVRNERKPMLVHTDSPIKIKVLGTVFNVNSYPDENNVKTTLVSGKVEVINQVEAANESFELVPSEQAIYQKESQKLMIQTVRSHDFISWEKNQLEFEDTPLSEVIEGLERKFNVEFSIQDHMIYDYRFTGSFSTATLADILKLLQISSPITYEIKGDIVILTKKEENME
jgi:ferric-dicitrate binding protein FerR (iron transport regulator)